MVPGIDGLDLGDCIEKAKNHRDTSLQGEEYCRHGNLTLRAALKTSDLIIPVKNQKMAGVLCRVWHSKICREHGTVTNNETLLLCFIYSLG